MNELLRFLLEQPLLLILLLGWLLGSVGSLIRKAEQRAREQRRRAETGTQSPVQGTAQVPTSASQELPRKASADDIAEQIRRMLGGAPTATPAAETDAELARRRAERQQRVEARRAEEQRQRAEAERKSRLAEPNVGGLRRDLDRRAETATKEADARRVISQAADTRRLTSQSAGSPALGSIAGRGEGSISPLAESLANRLSRTAAPAWVGRRLVKGRDLLGPLTDPATAFVLMEVLGPPRAMRELDAR